MDFLSITVMLFLVMDPVGNIPAFLSILEKVPAERRRKILLRELLFAFAILIFFIFCGRPLLGFLGLSKEAISISGGIILFLIALKMIFPAENSKNHEPEEEPFLVPLAIPLIAGPSTLAILMMYSAENIPVLILATTIAWAGSFVVLFSATYLFKVLKKRGLTAIERLMGMLLVALSVQLFLDGLASYLKV